MLRMSAAALLAAALSFAGVGRAFAEAPCANVARTLPAEPRLAERLAEQLKAPSARVLQSFAYRGWRILYVATPTADEAFVFFSGDPATSRYVTLWAGAAQPDETESIRKWALENAPGIPPHLAACFADHVTRHRDG